MSIYEAILIGIQTLIENALIYIVLYSNYVNRCEPERWDRQKGLWTGHRGKYIIIKNQYIPIICQIWLGFARKSARYAAGQPAMRRTARRTNRCWQSGRVCAPRRTRTTTVRWVSAMRANSHKLECSQLLSLKYVFRQREMISFVCDWSHKLYVSTWTTASQRR